MKDEGKKTKNGGGRYPGKEEVRQSRELDSSLGRCESYVFEVER
jgi:hypothetical protein